MYLRSYNLRCRCVTHYEQTHADLLPRSLTHSSRHRSISLFEIKPAVIRFPLSPLTKNMTKPKKHVPRPGTDQNIPSPQKRTFQNNSNSDSNQNPITSKNQTQKKANSPETTQPQDRKSSSNDKLPRKPEIHSNTHLKNTQILIWNYLSLSITHLKKIYLRITHLKLRSFYHCHLFRLAGLCGKKPTIK